MAIQTEDGMFDPTVEIESYRSQIRTCSYSRFKVGPDNWVFRVDTVTDTPDRGWKF